MDYLPLFFNINKERCLLVGGGEIAARKAELLINAGAEISVIAPEICQRLQDLVGHPPHICHVREFQPSDLEHIHLVVCATDNQSLNKEVSNLARQQKLPVNVVDDVDLSSVIFPSIVDRSPVLIAASSGGASPVLSRKIREMIETIIPSGFGRLASFLGEKRQALKQRYPDVDNRRRVTEAFLSSPGEELAMQGNYVDASPYLLPKSVEQDQQLTGEVYLVGAGPGDPDLLTLKALHLMQKADDILYDNLVSRDILSRVRRDARLINVGKGEGSELTHQESINELLIRLAKEGRRVLRLKGGDPFIFGRGGEEVENLITEGISFQVVPGITAANGCAAYAGIPLTHRDYSQSVRFVTGHPRDGEVDLEWSEFVHANQTIVFYMGLAGLDRICSQLISHGREEKTPVAIISKGTTSEQKVLIGNLGTICNIVESESIERPTLIIVGEVVALHDSLTPAGTTRS